MYDLAELRRDPRRGGGRDEVIGFWFERKSRGYDVDSRDKLGGGANLAGLSVIDKVQCRLHSDALKHDARAVRQITYRRD